MRINPNFDFKPNKPQVMMFLRRYVYNTENIHTVTAKELTNVFYYQYFNKRPLSHEKEKLDAMSRFFGRCITDFSKSYPYAIQKKQDKSRKYIIKPIR